MSRSRSRSRNIYVAKINSPWPLPWPCDRDRDVTWPYVRACVNMSRYVHFYICIQLNTYAHIGCVCKRAHSRSFDQKARARACRHVGMHTMHVCLCMYTMTVSLVCGSIMSNHFMYYTRADPTFDVISATLLLEADGHACLASPVNHMCCILWPLLTRVFLYACVFVFAAITWPEQTSLCICQAPWSVKSVYMTWTLICQLCVYAKHLDLSSLCICQAPWSVKSVYTMHLDYRRAEFTF